MLLQKKALILSTENDMQRGHYDVEQRHKTAIKQLQYRYKKNFGRCNNLTMRLWANSGSSPVRTAKVNSKLKQSSEIQGFQSFFFFSASAKNSGFKQFSRGLFVGLFESCFCSHELTHLSLIVSFLRSWFLSVAN